MRYLTIALVCCCLLPAHAQKPPPEPEPVPIWRAATPPVIDGKLDDACWQEAAVSEGRFTPKGKELPAARFTVRYAWDAHYLYIGYDVHDADVWALTQDAPAQGPPGNQRLAVSLEEPADLIEFFLAFNSDKYLVELHHNARNDFSDVLAVVVEPDSAFNKSVMCRWGFHFNHGVFIEDEREHTLQRAVRLKPRADGRLTTVNAPGDEDAGWTGELRLPWYGLSLPFKFMEVERGEDHKVVRVIQWKLAGQELRMFAAQQDFSSKDRYIHNNPRHNGSWFHSNAPNWQRFRLMAEAK